MLRLAYSIVLIFVLAAILTGRASLPIPVALAQEQPPPTAPATTAQQPFTYETVVERARGLARETFTAPVADLPDALRNADYDAFRQIRFRADRALWRGQSMFEVQFFHLGFLYREAVQINVVDGGIVSQVMFDPTMFDYGESGLGGEARPGTGFAGFRVHFPLHRPDYKDEVAVFLGASYFRVLGREQKFGASARGLAVDTAMPNGEEFPIFREFWLVRPQRDDPQLTIYALLDSQRITGGYRFIIDPGSATIVDVQATIFAREDIDKVGIAPMTSMFLYGESRFRTFDDYRPEVHDSDGLFMHNGRGEYIWRPLVNHQDLIVSAFLDENPRGFGLLQRDRTFTHYLDLEANYSHRPSYWVEPKGDWGPGTVELVEIPSDMEINDNIVAYWVSDSPLTAGSTREFGYRLLATLDQPIDPPLGKAVRTHLGSPSVPGHDDDFPEDARLFVVDFEGGDLPHLAAEQPVEAKITASAGRIIDQIVLKIPETDGWRVAFRVDPEGNEDVDLILKLMLYGKPIAENWAFRWRS